ncbi:MAG: flagellar basal body rod protein FlgB [Alphaproteobacteria bacterium]
MDLNAIPLFTMLRGKLGYLNQRQQLIAQNVANADTPGYTPKDLKEFTFQGQLDAQASGSGMHMLTTNPRHMTTSMGGGGTSSLNAVNWTPEARPDSETTLDGNQVSLEDQMVKMNQARMDYDAAITFYQKSMSLIRMAARRPGQ